MKLLLVLMLAATMPRDPELPRIERQVFEGINRERRDLRLAELKWNDRVAAEARRHALNMAGRRFFSHHDPVRGDLGARLRADGIAYRISAENIYQEKGFAEPAAQAVKSWMRSPGHRSNIVDSELRETGVGAAYSGDGTIYVDQVFITPLPSEGPPKKR